MPRSRLENPLRLQTRLDGVCALELLVDVGWALSPVDDDGEDSDPEDTSPDMSAGDARFDTGGPG